MPSRFPVFANSPLEPVTTTLAAAASRTSWLYISDPHVKRILILTAGFGEVHNSAARGVRAGLARIAPRIEVELRDLFPETFGAFNEFVRRAYLFTINRWPKSWGYVYNWLDRKKDFDKRF